MLDALYLKTIEKRNEINEFFENIAEQIEIANVKKEYVPKKFDKNIQDKNFSAIDGSFNKTKYMAGYIYAITSQTIVSKSGQNVFKESTSADINTVSTIYNNRIDRLLSLQMNIFELKSTIDTLRKHDDIHYMLMDGSLRGSLMSFRPLQYYDIPKKLTMIFPEYYRQLEESIGNNDLSIEITTERIKGELSRECEKLIKMENMDYSYKDNEMNILMYLESIEQLLCIYYLLKEFKDKIICISKTSSTKSLFNEFIPDSAVIEYTCDESGYTRPRLQESNNIIREINGNKVTIDYPVRNRQLSDNVFTTSFVKLEDKSNVLKIELPRKIEEKTFEEILADLESVSVEGYPHILKKAHDEVKIESKFMDRIQRNLGIYDKTGRDMLN